MNVRPLGSQLFVERIVRDAVRPSGIYVPDVKMEKSQEGRILAVGPDVRSSQLKVGRKIYFGQFSIDKLPQYLSLREVDVLAVVDENGIQPLGRFLVKMISVKEDHQHLKGQTLKAMGLVTVDKQKHWNHPARRGVIVATDPNLNTDLDVGDVIVFHGAAGFTLDGDVLDTDFPDLEDTVKGENYRWIKVKEVDAVDLLETAQYATLHPIPLEALAHV